MDVCGSLRECPYTRRSTVWPAIVPLCRRSWFRLFPFLFVNALARPVPHRSVVPLGLLTVVLMVAGCVMPDRDEPPATEVEEVVVATPTPPPTVIVTTDSNVRAGPGIDHAAHFWLATDTEVAVTGRNADGTWLRIGHEGRPGWIFGAEALAALPDTTPKDMTATESVPIRQNGCRH